MRCKYYNPITGKLVHKLTSPKTFTSTQGTFSMCLSDGSVLIAPEEVADIEEAFKPKP